MKDKNIVRSFESLIQFMHGKLPHRPNSRHTIEEWNEAREDAKLLYPEHLISRLDASAIIKQFNLKSSKQ